MMRNQFLARTSPVRIAGYATAAVAALLIAASCTENLPVGPDSFAAGIAILVTSDTIIVGDSSIARAQATDGQGHLIQGLVYSWASTDSSTVGFAALPQLLAPAKSDTISRRSLVARKTGRSVVTLSLPDPRFVASSVTRNETAVVGGVRVLSSRDSTLTALNDTALAIAAGLVHVNGAFVTRASMGIRWIHLGQHMAVVGQGDTIRYISRSNGADTLIATHDFCFAAAKCADTAVVKVNQQLTLALSGRSFAAWSFGDSLGPTVTLADRRGSGLAGTSVRFVPITAADSAIVQVTGPLGTANPVTGLQAAPKLVSVGNGTARVRVLGLGTDGLTVVSTDSITEVVRQVARRVAVEPQRAMITGNDSIPIRPLARDARGATIADATVFISASGITINGIWAGPTAGIQSPTLGSITPSLQGVALPQNNPAAPQVPVVVDQSVITMLRPDTATAGVTQRTASSTVLDSLGQFAVNQLVRFNTSFGTVPDPVQVDGNGLASAVWTPPDSAANYTVTGVRGVGPLNTLTDSMGRIVIRRSIAVINDVSSATRSTLGVSATTVAANGTLTVTVTLRDRFGNIVKNGTPADFSLTTGVGGGTLSAATCTQGVCTATYTAPAAAGPDTISAKILGTDILFSPFAITVM